jgi:hypothetical protein
MRLCGGRQVLMRGWAVEFVWALRNAARTFTVPLDKSLSSYKRPHGWAFGLLVTVCLEALTDKRLVRRRAEAL